MVASERRPLIVTMATTGPRYGTSSRPPATASTHPATIPNGKPTAAPSGIMISVPPGRDRQQAGAHAADHRKDRRSA